MVSGSHFQLCGFKDGKLTADHANQRLGNFPMPRHGRTLAISRILENGMTVPFANQHATMSSEMANQVPSLHGVGVATCVEMC